MDCDEGGKRPIGGQGNTMQNKVHHKTIQGGVGGVWLVGGVPPMDPGGKITRSRTMTWGCKPKSNLGQLAQSRKKRTTTTGVESGLGGGGGLSYNVRGVKGKKKEKKGPNKNQTPDNLLGSEKT